jgi:hypothetical protein
MGLARFRIARRSVVPRRNLAEAAIKDLLDARSKHDLARDGAVARMAPPRVLD